MVDMRFEAGFKALVIGASGGIGSALVTAIRADPKCGGVIGLSRGSQPAIDVTDEASLAAAAAALVDTGPFHLIVTTVGVLHDNLLSPEKALRSIDPAQMSLSFFINAIGPIMVIKHFTPLLPKSGRCVMATLSARVGSIGDNRLGGWYSYRAAKAALNQLVHTAAIEVARSRPDAVVLSLHPGSVATRLTGPFSPNHEVFTPADAAQRLLGVIAGAGAERTGTFLAYDGSTIPW